MFAIVYHGGRKNTIPERDRQQLFRSCSMRCRIVRMQAVFEKRIAFPLDTVTRSGNISPVFSSSRIPSDSTSVSLASESHFRFCESVVQYSQYCRGPAAKTGSAEHEIPARSGSTRPRTRICRNGKFESSGHLQMPASWERRLSLLSELIRQRGTRPGFSPSNSPAGESHPSGKPGLPSSNISNDAIRL